MTDEVTQVLKKYNGIPDMLGAEFSTVEDKNEFGDQALHLACVRGDLEDIKVLVSAGADINATGENGFTPLHYAVEQEKTDVVKFLLQKNVRLDIVDEAGNTALKLAALLELPEIERLLNKCGAG